MPCSHELIFHGYEFLVWYYKKAPGNRLQNCVFTCFLRQGSWLFYQILREVSTPERKEPLLWGLDLGLPVGKAVVDIHWAPTHKAWLST